MASLLRLYNFYRDLNPSTLSGAIDVIVIKSKEDNELRCTPFHVRFGKLKLLLPQEKTVSITVNNELVDLHMKVGDQGEAFFVVHAEGVGSDVDSDYWTSPIIPPVNTENTQVDHLDLEDYVSAVGSEASSAQGSLLMNESTKNELILDKFLESSNLNGNFLSNESSSALSKFQRQRSNSAVFSAELMAEKLPNNAMQLHNDAISDTEFELQKATESSWTWGNLPKKKRNMSTSKVEEAPLTTNDIYSSPEPSTADETIEHVEYTKEVMGETFSLRLNDAQIEDSASAFENEATVVASTSVMENDLFVNEEIQKQTIKINTEVSMTQQDAFFSPMTIKESFPTTIDENTFPISAEFKERQFTKLVKKIKSEQENSQKPSMVNDEVNHITTMVSDEIQLSLCGPLQNLLKEDVDKLFEENIVLYDEYWKDPISVLRNAQLVVKLGDQYFPYQEALPLILSQAVFGKYQKQTFNQENKVTGRTLTNRYSAYFKSWFSSKSQGNSLVEGSGAPVKSSLNNFKSDTQASVSATNVNLQNGTSMTFTQRKSFENRKSRQSYIKSLRLSPDQLKSLKLKHGINPITFSVNSEIQGTATCSARIFLWDSDEKIVISDIDGTITKSDALGHLFTMVGKDWTHSGVAQLYTNIYENGYKIMYLTSRAIGQAEATRDYLKKVEQGPYQLPDGPVIMSPDRLFSALRREVILRRPQEFKMACLKDIKSIFVGNPHPFYAGFGNRITDALSYMSVDIPASRIFTIDPAGEVKLELLTAFKSSYIKLKDLVDHIFPALTIQTLQTEFADFNFWKTPLPAIDIFQDNTISSDEDEEDEEIYSDEEENDETI